MVTKTERSGGLTQERLKSLLSYDPATGIFRWKVDIRCGANNRLMRRSGDVAGSVTDSGYGIICLAYKRYYAHRLAWFYMTGKWPENQVDHIDLDRSNNRFDNLRQATVCQNGANRRTRAKSGFKGVVKLKQAQGSYMAQISIDGVPKYLGCYPSAELAHAAYLQAAVARHGEFLRTD